MLQLTHKTVNICNDAPLPTRRLLLNLLAAVDGGTLSANQAVRAGAVFGISATSIRVTLTRLAKADLIELHDRGSYRLGRAARAIGSVVATWHEVEGATVPWDGAWIACHLGGLSSRDRTAARASARAIAIGGMQALAPGLFVRPDNLRGGVEALRERLRLAGISKDAIFFTMRDLDSVRAKQAIKLWDGAALSKGYRRDADKLRRWLARAEPQPTEAMARDIFLTGDGAIRKLLFDPLLPAPLVDEAARAELVALTKQFDAYGHAVWRDLLGSPSI